MSDDRKPSVVWWQPSPQRDPPPKRRETPRTARTPPYLRSIGWAMGTWMATVAAVYFVAQVGGEERLGGWLGAAGLVAGYWVGGTRGGIKGWREWAVFIAMLSGIAFLLLGFAACVASIALYG